MGARGVDGRGPVRGGARLDYRAQARTYDRTRAASPSILEPIVEALAAAPGRALLDVGGGTGNYAAALRERGWEPRVLDRSTEMLARAAAKGLAVVRADATCLPLSGAAVDAVTMISMLHLVPGWRGALAEARRVLRPGGRLAIMAYTRENLGVHWIWSYFPASLARLEREHQGVGDLARGAARRAGARLRVSRSPGRLGRGDVPAARPAARSRAARADELLRAPRP